MKRAVIYVVALGIVCLGVGVAAGMLIEKKNTTKNLPGIMRGCMLRKHEGRGFPEMGQRGKWGQTRQKKGGADGVLGRLGKELSLSDEQQGSVKEILEQAKEKVTLARDEFNTKTTQLKEESNTRIMEVLTPEQQEKYQKIITRMEERKTTMQERMKKCKEQGEFFPQH